MQTWKKYFLPAAAGAVLIVALLYVFSSKLPVNTRRAFAAYDADAAVTSPAPTDSAADAQTSETPVVVVTNTLPTPLAVNAQTTNGANNNDGGNRENEEESQPPLVVAPVPASELKASAVENARLQYDMQWAFGGKAQYGWFIYVPLVQQTTGAKTGAETAEFAAAVAAWQRQFGLTPTGKLDSDTLYKMVAYWQSRRLNDATYPAPNQLLTAPPADFYDPSRLLELRGVERETYAAYKRLVAAAIKDPTLNLKANGDELAPDEKFLKIVSAFRSREYQAQLRKQSPNSGRAGLATNSPHFTGHALDVYVGGEPVITKDANRAFQVQTPVYKWLVKNAERFGFYPYYYEPWHWEYVPNRLKTYTEPAK